MGNTKVTIEVGKTYQSKYDGEYTVTAIISKRYVEIEFADTGQVQYCSKDKVGRVKLRDWSKPQICGIGYSSGDHDHPDTHSTLDNYEAFHTWQNMIERCFDGKSRGYKRVWVDDSWRDFRNFLKWHEENYYERCDLDKDLFSPPGYKRYSPDTCCFLPKEINQWLRFYVRHINGEVKPAFPMDRIIIPLTDMLVKYQGQFTPRAEQRLWEICAKHGFTELNFVERKTIVGLKHDAVELCQMKDKARIERENTAYANKVGTGFPLVGFVEYNGRIRRIRNFSDLSALYSKCKSDILTARHAAKG